MLRGAQNQNAKRQPVEHVRANSGVLDKVFEIRRDPKSHHMRTFKENSRPDQTHSAAPAKSNTQLLSRQPDDLRPIGFHCQICVGPLPEHTACCVFAMQN